MDWCRDIALPDLDQRTVDLFAKYENRPRGSLIAPLARESKIDLSREVALVTTELDEYQPIVTFPAIDTTHIEEQPDPHWRTRAARKQRGKVLQIQLNAYSKRLPAAHQIRDFASFRMVVVNLKRFRELVRLKKVLSEPLFFKLRQQFQMIDSDNTGYITVGKAQRVNILLAPHLKLKHISEDADRLFELAQIQTHISELHWLQSWAKQVRKNHYHLGFVQDFVDSFDKMDRDTNMRHVLESDYLCKVGVQVLCGMMKWKDSAIKKIAMRPENIRRERALQKRRNTENKALQTLMGKTMGTNKKKQMGNRKRSKNLL